MAQREKESASKTCVTLLNRTAAVNAAVAATIWLSSCSSVTEPRETEKQGANQSRAAATANTIPPSNAGPPMSGAGTNVVTPSNQQNTDSVGQIEMARNRRAEAMRETTVAGQPDVETLLKQSAKPAPENSELSVALTDILVERRTFLKHPILSKVEKITRGNEVTIHVFTRDGRQIKLPGSAIVQLANAPTATILKAANLEAPAAAPADSKPAVRKAN